MQNAADAAAMAGAQQLADARSGNATAADIRDVLIEDFGWETTGAPIRSVEGMIAELKR